MLLSVILCTHNPRPDYLQRTLKALAGQSLPTTQWELILVDNRSEPSLTSECLAGLHAQSRLVREETLGLTPARLCGIRESKSQLLVFVDDDNELAPDYLEAAAALADRHPHVGVFSASIRAEYETLPPAWIHYFEPFLAIRELQSDVIGTQAGPHIMPIGAGMVVRRSVAFAYAQAISNSSARFQLGRKGNALLAAEDTDIGYTAFDLGLACGAFQCLKLNHLIPSRRLRLEYLEKLAEDVQYSQLLLERVRGGAKIALARRLKLRLGLGLFRIHPNRIYGRYRCALLRAKLRCAADHP